MPKSYIKRILNARVYDVARETPVDEAVLMSRRLANRVWLKREDLQPVFSFKLRGAYNKMSRLSEEQRARGVVAASAGNHAQGLAMAAQKMNVRATIVMPRTTPLIKVDAVRNRGARVVLHGDSFDEAAGYAAKLVAEKDMVYIHPFDDPDVIAGQGTIGMEIVRQHQQPLDALFVPVGGGGLLAGVAAYVSYVWPGTRIIGVEPEDAACLLLALERGRRDILPEVGPFADGCAVAQVGKETFRVIRDTVDEVITVSTDEMCAAIKDIFEDTRSIAADNRSAQVFVGLSVVPGGEDLAELLANLAAHGYVTEDLTDNEVAKLHIRYMVGGHAPESVQNERVYRVEFPERPGALLGFLSGLGQRWNISMFHYRNHGAAYGRILVGVQVPGKERREFEKVLETLNYRYWEETTNRAYQLYLGKRAPTSAES